MNNNQKIEALLYLAGEDGLLLSDLSSLTGLSLSACQQQIDRLEEKYEEDSDSALTVIKTAERFRLTTKEELSDLLKSYAQSSVNQSLSKSAVDALSIVAYKQPITRLEIDNYRGVASSGVLSTLRSFGLIDVVGKLEAPGRPSLYATTPFFLDYMGINSLDELPTVESESEASEREESQLFKDERPLVEEGADDFWSQKGSKLQDEEVREESEDKKQEAENE